MRFGLKKRNRKIKVPAVFILVAAVVFFAPVSSRAAVTITGNFDDTASGSDGQNPGINFLLLGKGDGRDAGPAGKPQAKNNWFKKFFSGFPSAAHALEPTAVSKVIVFFTNGNYVSTEVVNGSFSLDVEKGSPAGMIFAGASSNYLGYLTLGNGIDSLPLHYDENNVETIDLGTLIESSSEGGAFESENNIFDNDIPLSLEEQSALALANNLFAEVVKNPDVNGNGVIDVLEEKFYALHLYYYFYGGDFLAAYEDGLTPKVNENTSDIWNGFKFGVRGELDWSDPVYFTGPVAQPSLIFDSSASQESIVFDSHTYYYSEYVDDPNNPYPPDGNYRIDYSIGVEDKTLLFTITGQSEASEKTVLPIPTIVLNNDDTIKEVTWVYRAASESASNIDPQVLVSGVELQISDNGSPRQRLYDSGNLPADTQAHDLASEAILWSTVGCVVLAYDDVYGNNNIVSWENKQTAP